MQIQSINPATEEVLGEWQEDDENEVELALEAVSQRFGDWRTHGVHRRADLMRSAAGELRQRKPELSHLITNEMAQPRGE